VALVVGEVEIDVAVEIVVEPDGLKAITGIIHGLRNAHVFERSVAPISIECIDAVLRYAALIVDRVEIEPTVAVEITETGAFGCAWVSDGGIDRHICECPISLIAHQDVWLVILAEIQINIPVAIVIASREAGGLRQDGNPVADRMVGELARAVVGEETDVTVGRSEDDDVGSAVSVEIGESAAEAEVTVDLGPALHGVDETAVKGLFGKGDRIGAFQRRNSVGTDKHRHGTEIDGTRYRPKHVNVAHPEN